MREAFGRALARHARASIAFVLGGPEALPPLGGDAHAATFVTIHRDGRLHGCMGSLEPTRPLVEDVAHNAVAAAFDDPRATPLSLEDVADLAIEVSVLGPLERIESADRASVEAALRPGVDGVVLELGARQATFLPQVWSELPDPAAFLDALLEKAGIPAWSDAIRVYRYTVEHFAEPPRMRRRREVIEGALACDDGVR